MAVAGPEVAHALQRNVGSTRAHGECGYLEGKRCQQVRNARLLMRGSVESNLVLLPMSGERGAVDG